MTTPFPLGLVTIGDPYNLNGNVGPKCFLKKIYYTIINVLKNLKILLLNNLPQDQPSSMRLVSKISTVSRMQVP